MKLQHYMLALAILMAVPLSVLYAQNNNADLGNWDISVIPSSIRLDPVTNEIIDYQYPGSDKKDKNLLNQNWIYNEDKVQLHGARGEYVSFQLVLQNMENDTLSHVMVDMSPFSGQKTTWEIAPELFLEWSVEVKTTTTGYPVSTLGKRWYPDALIPMKFIQQDSANIHRWTYPLWVPDFNNRIDDQKSLIIWVDQFIPAQRDLAAPGTYQSTIEVSIQGVTKEIPVNLEVWDFNLPNENQLGASLQHEGFVSRMSKEDALHIYQLMKRNRISVMDPTYSPEMDVTSDGNVNIDWSQFDDELEKYFTGKAFTKEYGYDYGPGYGEPIENFVLPFDVYGKHGTLGWPDIGKPDVEQLPENKKIYTEAIKEVRTHLQKMVNPEKTDLTIYLNGLDESYFRQAWDRMVYYGDLFHEYYPEAHFRIDGAYSEEAMDYVKNSIDYWAAHTINYDPAKVKKYHDMGIKDWLYGPMIYESEVNSWVGSSTILDLLLLNDRAISWACWKYDTHSWISWGIGAGWSHAWYDCETWKDAYRNIVGADPDYEFKKINGSEMILYRGGIVPNVSEPVPSIRLKTMRDGVQEYEYMRLLSGLDGKDERVDEIINEIIHRPFGKQAIGNLN